MTIFRTLCNALTALGIVILTWELVLLGWQLLRLLASLAGGCHALGN